MVIVYKCVFTGSEMISDSYPTSETYDGYIIECQSQTVVKDALDLGIGEADDCDDQAEKVNSIVDGFAMMAMEMKKGEFQSYIKKYMAKIIAHLTENAPDRVDGFKKNATLVVKMLLGSFDDCEFYMGDKDPSSDGHIGIGFWKNPETDTAPTFIYFKDGLKGEKY